MSERDLKDALGRAAGAAGERPGLEGLWRHGRRRSTRNRVLGAAAAVVVLGLVVGAVALAAGRGEGGDVVAGPSDGTDVASVPAPPAEPVDRILELEVAAGPVVDGLPTAIEGELLEVTYVGLADTFDRGRLATWEAWDGTTWVERAGLIAADGPDGGDGGEVVPLDPSPTVPEDLRTGRGPDTFPTPDDLAPGWYRVCMPMTARGAIAETTMPDGVDVSTTFVEDGEVIRPCAQLRVPDPDAPAEDPSTDAVEVDPPPAEPTSPITITAPDAAVAPGAVVALEVGMPDGGSIAGNTTWEQWDGFSWVPTHLITGFLPTRSDPGLVSLTGDEDVEIPPDGYSTDAPTTTIDVLVPPLDEITSGWSRVCVDAPADTDDRPCVQLAVDGAPDGVDPAFAGVAGLDPGEPEGDEAQWTIDADAPPSADATTVMVLATRVGCANGETGELLEPYVVLGPDEILIRIDAAPLGPGGYTCPGNDAVPVTVEIGEPIGDRRLVDGWCRVDATIDAPACEPDGVRWPLPG